MRNRADTCPSRSHRLLHQPHSAGNSSLLTPRHTQPRSLHTTLRASTTHTHTGTRAHKHTHVHTSTRTHTCTLAVVTPLQQPGCRPPSGAPEPVRSRKEHGRAGGRKHRRQACWGAGGGGDSRKGTRGRGALRRPRLPDSCLCDSATLSKIRSP